MSRLLASLVIFSFFLCTSQVASVSCQCYSGYTGQLCTIACPTSCASCPANNPSTCSVCGGGNYLSNNLCVSPVGYITSPYPGGSSLTGRQCGYWSGTPTVNGYFFLPSVPLSQVCSALGFLYSDLLSLPALTVSTTTVCSIWSSNGVLSVLDSTNACAAMTQYLSNVTCSTACGSNCIACNSNSVCTTCGGNMYLNSIGQCVAYGQCGTGYYSVSSSQSVGLTCTACTTCGSNYYASTTCSATSNTVCTMLTTCASGSIVVKPPTATSDRQCKACTPCPSNQYIAGACHVNQVSQNVSTFIDNACLPCTNCTSGSLIQIQACTMTSNSLCTTCSTCNPYVQAASNGTINTVYSIDVIVQLRSYQRKRSRRNIISRLLEQHVIRSLNLEWKFRPKISIMQQLPSDFEVVTFVSQLELSFLQPPLANVITLLRQDEHVKYVGPDRLLRVALHTLETNSSEKDGLELISPRRLKLGPIGKSSADKHSISPCDVLGVRSLWSRCAGGRDVVVAVLDSGLDFPHPHFKNVAARIDWTDNNDNKDHVGHGTLVAGIVASQGTECKGMAPNASLHIYKVFNHNQMSYTSWFLDAFNYAIVSKVNVINLSIGGPDFHDEPFTDKVAEVSSAGIIMVTAIGNDGPTWGTLNTPADMSYVIGVGGLNGKAHVATFSSRGMVIHDLPSGYGRVKPDVLTASVNVKGSQRGSGCMTSTGTSVASPIVAGAIALLIAALPLSIRNYANPAFIKQALLASSSRLQSTSSFIQGAGQLNVPLAFEIIQNQKPHASAFPSELDTTECYSLPLCGISIYATSMPLLYNFTILSSLSATSWMDNVRWIPDRSHGGSRLRVVITYSEVLWPWSGYLFVRIHVDDRSGQWRGIARGTIVVTVKNHPTNATLTSDVVIGIKVRVIPTPPRRKRLLWDQFHSLQYPSGYFPNDNLRIRSQPLDFHGDHPHTNFIALSEILYEQGYFLEVLGEPFSCFNASYYAALIIMDSEEEFFVAELDKLYDDVQTHGLSILVVADWYNTDLLSANKFFDENTRSLWLPETGGANLPALNELLAQWDVAFSSQVFEGSIQFANMSVDYLSGTSIANFPRGGHVIYSKLVNLELELLHRSHVVDDVPILGLLPSPNPNHGNIVVFGDSSVFDSSNGHAVSSVFVKILLDMVVNGIIPRALHSHSVQLEDALSTDRLPTRVDGNTLYLYSRVIDSDNSRLPQPHCRRDVFHAESAPIPTIKRELTRSLQSIEMITSPLAIDSHLDTDDATDGEEGQLRFFLLMGFGAFIVAMMLMLFFVWALSRTRRRGQRDAATSSSKTLPTQIPGQDSFKPITKKSK